MDVLRLTLRQLQVFVAVAAGGGTAAAGEAIALSQSATSSAVNELERVLSLRLFERVGKRLRLNENGRALLPRAQALLDAAAGIERMARDGLAQAETLRIGASTTVGNYLLPGLFARFVADRPPGGADAWQSRVTIANTAAVCDAVAAFELDVGLVEGPCHLAALAVTPWVQDELVVVAAAHGALARTAGRVPLRALREAVWLVREPGSGTREATDQGLLPHLRSYRRCIELGSSEAIKHAVIEGLGVACLSSWVVADALASGRLVRLSTALPRLLRQCHVVVHRARHATPALARFVAQAHAAARPGTALAAPTSPQRQETSMATYGKKAAEKVEATMDELKAGTLKSGSGKKVTSRKQAVAIGLSEARREGGKVPPAPKKKAPARKAA